ncbi:MAG TPA: caspase family protein [Usitatibacteraceae bacterium]|nr:caspase family protein [Usitatibacteraceae bacterium]HQY45922.1 caspase family protein [Usitatibacteraceae bacterium]HRA21965.1 caspase family protein [Usitatibacteraceae bacterium]
MTLHARLARLALLAAALASATILPALAEKKIALVIGNAAYPAAPLRNPVNDARAMAERLKAIGYDVALHTDVAQRDFTRAVSQFGQRLAPGSVALFYYAGHGMQVRGRNFLVPVDADIQSEASARSEAVDLDLVLEQLGPSRLAMVILDACRNNPFEGRFRSAGGSGLAQVDAPKGTLLAYATAPGKVASDGEGSHGLYTAELMKAMDLPGAKVEEVFKAVRVNVIKATAGAQVPWESSSLTGDYFFRPAVAARPVAEPKQADLQAKLEAERRQREKDAAALKAEMEKLREEVRRLGVAAAPAPAPEPAPAKPATGKPATAKPAPAKAAEPKPVAGGALRDAGAREWARRIASLEELRGQLSFSKAAAILLGPFTDEQLLVLVGKERALKDLPYSSAFALGVTAKGTLAAGRSWGARSPQVAEEIALENCARHAARRCQVIVVNGEFREAGFVAWAGSSTGKSLLQLRLDLLRLRAEAR